MTLKLYKTNISPAVRSVYLTGKALGIDFEYVEVNLLAKENLTPEFLKLNPQHTVPTLEDDGHVIWDSHAINIYLVSKYGNDDSLYPEDHYKRAVVNQRLHFESGVVFPLLRRIVRPILYKGAKTVPEDLVNETIETYNLLETFLKGRKWVAGDELTLADFSFLPSVTELDVLVPINAAKYPNITGWLQRGQQLPYYHMNQSGLNDFKACMTKLMRQ